MFARPSFGRMNERVSMWVFMWEKALFSQGNSGPQSQKTSVLMWVSKGTGVSKVLYRVFSERE